MDNKIKKSRKGKKSWRKNIDMEEVHESIIKQNKEKTDKELLAQIKKKISKEDQNKLFTIDDASSKKKRAPLDPNRFKKKERVELPLKSDRKLVNKLAREGKTKLPEEPKEKQQNLEWKQTDEGRLEYKHSLPQKDIAAVILPHAGQSYNPSYAKHQELLDSIVQNEVESDQIKVFGSKKGTKSLNNSTKKIKKLKNVRHQKVLDQQEAQKQIKKVRNEASHLNVYSKQIDKQNQKIREQHKIAEEKQELVKREKAKGIVEKSKYGKHRYEMRTPEFQQESELCDNFRRLKPSNDLHLKERFDTVYRTRMLEKSEPWRAKAKLRVPRFKVTDLNRRRDDLEDEQLGNFQDKLNFKDQM